MMRAATLATLVVLATALLAACGSDKAPAAGNTGTPTASSTDDPAASASGVYIALGNSLSAGVGASSPETTFAGIVHNSLGAGFELMNLGHSGDTSDDLIQHGHLEKAAAAIESRNGDDDAANDVRLVTLEIGCNDLLGIYFSLVQTGTCPDEQTALAKPVCTEALHDALDGFRPNFDSALERLREADADVRITVMTLYNPFDFLGAFGDLGALSLEGRAGTEFPEGMNDIIRAVAAGYEDVTIADVYTAFKSRTAELLSSDFIHPNDAGYRTMADAVIAALP